MANEIIREKNPNHPPLSAAADEGTAARSIKTVSKIGPHALSRISRDIKSHG
jgi:hypothetical protein